MPDGPTLVPLREGLGAVWNSTAVDTMAETHMTRTSMITGKAPKIAEGQKVRISMRQQFLYRLVLRLRSFGPFCQVHFQETWLYLHVKSSHSRSLGDFRHRLSIALQRRNGYCVLETIPLCGKGCWRFQVTAIVCGWCWLNAIFTADELILGQPYKHNYTVIAKHAAESFSLNTLVLLRSVAALIVTDQRLFLVYMQTSFQISVLSTMQCIVIFIFQRKCTGLCPCSTVQK